MGWGSKCGFSSQAIPPSANYCFILHGTVILGRSHDFTEPHFPPVIQRHLAAYHVDQKQSVGEQAARIPADGS